MLERAMRTYNNRSITGAEVIVELVAMAQQLKLEYDRGARLGLRDDELAFYDAVCQNDSAVLELGDETIEDHYTRARHRGSREHERRLGQTRAGPRASLRHTIRRLLAKHRYPQDKQEAAVQLVMTSTT